MGLLSHTESNNNLTDNVTYSRGGEQTMTSERCRFNVKSLIAASRRGAKPFPTK